MNTITLGAKPIYDRPAGHGGLTNFFAMHAGSSFPGMGRFVMVREDYEAIASEPTNKPPKAKRRKDRAAVMKSPPRFGKIA